MYLDRLFKLMAEKQASDIFISCGAPINIKVNGVVSPVSTQPMDPETVRRIAYELMTKDQAREFENEPRALSLRAASDQVVDDVKDF